MPDKPYFIYWGGSWQMWPQGFSFVIPTLAWDWYDLLKDFQAGLVGLLGFTGVMATLWWNARLSRIARILTIAHETRSIRVAIAQELLNFHLRIKSSRDIRAPNYFFNYLPNPEIYTSHLSKIGFLEEDEVLNTVSAYTMIELIKEKMPSEKGHEWGSSRIISEEADRDDLRRRADMTLQSIEMAVKCLSNRVSPFLGHILYPDDK